MNRTLAFILTLLLLFPIGVELVTLAQPEIKWLIAFAFGIMLLGISEQ